jgi:predicted RNA-binding protein with RPS1 domain
MGLIKEPLDVDFTVDPRVLTTEEKNAISEYIRNYKTQRIKNAARKSNSKQSTGKKEQAKHC